MRIRDEQLGSHFRELRNNFLWVKILKFFDADPGSRMEKIRIRDEKIRIWDGKSSDPGWKKFGSGIKSQIRNTASASEFIFGSVFALYAIPNRI
jgi:hypothetical protein